MSCSPSDLEMERNGDKAYDVVERISSKEMNHERGDNCRSEKRRKEGLKGEDYLAGGEKEGEGGEDCLLLLDLPGLGQAGERYSSSPLSSCNMKL